MRVNESKPNSLEWLLKYADGHHQMGDTEKAIACMKDAEDRFGEYAEYLFRLGKYHAILGNVEEAKKLVKVAIEKDVLLKGDFIAFVAWALPGNGLWFKRSL